MLRTIALSCVLLCTSCASLNFDAPDADFGPRPTPIALKTAAGNYLDGVMFDSASKRQRWVDQQPRLAALWRGLIFGGWHHGWGMRFRLNGKNRFGGYVGEKDYFVIQVGTDYYVGEGSIEVDDRPARPPR